MRIPRTVAVVAMALTLATSAWAKGPSKGTPDWKSAGPLTFGPDGVLFMADTQGAAVFAVETGDRSGSVKPVNVDGLNEKIAEALGTTPDKIVVADMAVNPASGKVYLSVARGKAVDAPPALVKVDASGKVEMVSLDHVTYSKAELPNPPAPGTGPRSPRAETITDLAFVDGRVFVAGLSNEEFSSRLLALAYPFTDSASGTSVEIFHGAHGRLETKSPVRTFVAYQIKGEPYLLAAYTCTPLVKFPVAAMKPGSHLKGTTVAELGNRNKPLDMIVYQKGGKDYLLMANSSRGVMKIPTEPVDKAEAITEPVKVEKKGVGYETIASLKGVMQLDVLDKDHALVLVQAPSGSMNLETIELP